MKEKKKIKLSIGATIIILIIVAVISIGVTYICTNNENNINNAEESNEKMAENIIEDSTSTEVEENKEEKINEDKTTNENTNTSKEADTADKQIEQQKIKTQTATSEDAKVQPDTSTSKPVVTTTNEYIGKWNTYQVTDFATGETTDNLRLVFGSSYSAYGSYFELKEDGTFKDGIDPVGNGEYATDGTYEIQENYYKAGDCYIFLTYSDGTKRQIQRIYKDDNNVPVLSLQILKDDGVTPSIQYDMKK